MRKCYLVNSKKTFKVLSSSTIYVDEDSLLTSSVRQGRKKGGKLASHGDRKPRYDKHSFSVLHSSSVVWG
jgi:hypothetical protein